MSKVPEPWWNTYRPRQILAEIVIDMLRSPNGHGIPVCWTAVDAALATLSINSQRTSNSAKTLCRHHPEVLRACAEFLMAHRSPEEIQALNTDSHPSSPVCRCIDRASTLTVPYLVDLHGPDLNGFSDIKFETEQTALHKLLTVLATHVYQALEAVETPTIFKVYRRNYRRSLKGRPDRWPTCQADVLPHGLDASVKNVCSWVDLYNNMVLLRLVEVIYYFVAQHAFPALLIRTIIPRAFLPIMSSAIDDWDAPFGVVRSSDQRYVERVLGIVRMLDEIQNMDERKIRVAVGDRVAPMVALEQLCARAAHNLSRISGTIKYANLRDIYQGRFEGCSVRLRYILDLDLPEDVRAPPPMHMRQQLRRFLCSDDPDPLRSWAAYARFILRQERCGNPGCGLTNWAAGRRLKMCPACRCVSYCSRRCQKQSWKNPRAEHRFMCGLLCDSLVRVQDCYHDHDHAGIPGAETLEEELLQLSIEAELDPETVDAVVDYLEASYTDAEELHLDV